jgi:excinuclease UvrABC ATPase subunit
MIFDGLRNALTALADDPDLGELSNEEIERRLGVCPVCHGEGWVTFNRSSDPQCEDEARCPECAGTGEAGC